jgi:histidinol-phosphatase (PHP family)
MEDVVKDAIAKGLDEIAITDHVDYGIKYDWDEIDPMPYRGKEPLANVNYPLWDQELTALQKKYAGQIVIRRGMEFGIQQGTIDRYETLFKRYPFDFIILSCHQVDNQEFWTGEFQKGRSQREYNWRYYDEIWQCMNRFSHYSVIGHLDLIARYDPAGPIALSEVEDQIAAILRKVIADGRGIELNTSWHRYGLKDSEPARAILKMYRDFGGTIITIGSDSHQKEHLGAYIDEAKEELLSLGFTSFCTYDHMEPVFHDLKD